jgi:anhydro-N-acetylmuramic acid kinase
MRVVGLMSGTSADGVDVALARIHGTPPRISATVERFVTLPYPADVREAILRIAEGAAVTAGDISELNFVLGEVFAKCALTALRRFGVSPADVDLIGSHGQTIFHQGGTRRSRSGHSNFSVRAAGSTLQVGEPAVIAARTGIPVVADFRPADIAAGGQGAPLVPFADYLLLRSAKFSRIALNLGGIANVTIIPAGAQPQEVTAFDTGPANMVIDALMRRFTRGQQMFDSDGAFAQRGRLLPGLLRTLMEHPYFAKRSPKTAGREQFGHAFVEEILSRAAAHRGRPQDVVHTVTILTAASIAQALVKMRLKQGAAAWELIVSGGGTHNPLLMAQLAALLPSFRILPSSAVGIPEDAKEALAFALLAYEAWHERPNSLPSATGARRTAILGKIVHACGTEHG